MSRSPRDILSIWIIVVILALVSVLASGLAGLIPVLLGRELGALYGFVRAVLPVAVAVLIALLALWASRLLVDAAHRDAARDLELARIRADLALSQQARELHHDLLNHLTVVSALLQMGSGDRALAYLRKVTYGHTGEEETASDVVEPTLLMGLMGQKVSRAARAGVTFEVRVDNVSEHLCIPDVVAARILGNLTDNAIDAASEAPDSTKKVTVEMVLSDTHCSFRVWNSGPSIPPEQLKRIFAAGETTKGGDHQGLGLHIVQQLVRDYGGSLDVRSDAASGTEFVVGFESPQQRVRSLGNRGIRVRTWSI